MAAASSARRRPAGKPTRWSPKGAALVDIGGESTRPGHVPVPAEEEQARVLPAIRALAPRLSVPISIDTYKASTAESALAAGARIVNDVWGLQREPDIAHVAADHGAPVMIMHNRETIDAGIDIVSDMLRFFERLAGHRPPRGNPRRRHRPRSGHRLRQELGAAPRGVAAPARDPRARLPAPRRRVAQVAARAACTIARRRPPTGSTGRSRRMPSRRRSAPTSCASTTWPPMSRRCGWSMRCCRTEARR